MKTYDLIALGIPEILIPTDRASHPQWAVIACDQYTSQPEYWQRAAREVGDAQSTLHMVYPEVFLAESETEAAARIASIESKMQSYLDGDTFTKHEGMIYVEREAAGRTRRGLMICLDLDAYDYNKGSGSLIRATEGTIVSRLPPRVKVREGAPLELPHIMVLIDDPEDSVIGPLNAAKESLESVYDFDLMLDGGRLRGYSVAGAEHEAQVVEALQALGAPDSFEARYELGAKAPVLLYAMGDGNHSLATAKAIWERIKSEAEQGTDISTDPRRYALVELVNLHDEAMVFEPIHRVLFGVGDKQGLIAAMNTYFGDRAQTKSVDSLAAMTEAVLASTAQRQRFGVVLDDHNLVVEIEKGEANLPVGTLQVFLDRAEAAGLTSEVDYVHGTDAVDELGRQAGNVGFFLPPMDKGDLFKTVLLDGALPRKTFSMGEADEKRFYMECRQISG